MRARKTALAILIALSFVTATASVLDAAEPSPATKVGFAERDITPEIGSEKPGGYGKSYHKTLHDPCKVRAAVFDDGHDRVALVGVDALIVPRSLVEGARKRIEVRCNIPGDHVLIGASHSHSSGPVGMVIPGEYDHASPLVQELAYEKSSGADPEYLNRVQQAVADAVVEATEKRQDAQCGVGKGVEDTVAFNRRFRMKNGRSHTHPGQGNPDIVEAAGPTDPEVGVVGAWDKEGKLLGCIVNFACHATTSPGGISANYIYYLEMAVRGYFGDDVVVVFFPGTCGDITQVDNLAKTRRPSGEESAQFVGGRVGAEAVKVLLGMQRGTFAPVSAKTKTLTIPRRVPRPERVQACLEMVRKAPKEVGTTEWTFAKEIVMLDAILAKHPTAEAEVQALQVGPAIFLSDPAEYFCEFGLDMKARSKFPFTFPVELANGCVGYVPTEEALSPSGGGYETRLTSYSNLIPSAGQQIADTAVELANQMAPGKVPMAPPAPKFSGNGWSYGNVPAELD